MPLDLAEEKSIRTQTTSLKYVLLRAGTGFGGDVTVHTENVTGAMDNLTTGLRPWLLSYLHNGFHDNGWYIGCLVAANENGVYDTYRSLVMEDVLWYWDQECVPVPSLTE